MKEKLEFLVATKKALEELYVFDNKFAERHLEQAVWHINKAMERMKSESKLKPLASNKPTKFVEKYHKLHL
jgi:hypothetical protein